MSVTQCAAVLSNNTRCRNIANNNFRHCDSHRNKATSLYLKYKEICLICDNLNINQHFDNIDDRINHVMKCYLLYNKAHNARAKHRKYAFVSELHDSGHNYQFELLESQMLKCEDILSQLYTENSSIENASITPNSVNNVSINNSIQPVKHTLTISEKIQKCRQRRKECEEYINQYIDDTEITRINKLLLTINIVKCINMMFGEYITNQDATDATDAIDESAESIENKDQDDDEKYYDQEYVNKLCNYQVMYIRCLMIFDLAHTLNNIGYFTGKFSIKRIYGFSLGTNKMENIVHLYDYLLTMSESFLKKGFEILLFNKNKLLPFTTDVRCLTSHFGKKCTTIKLCLVWKNEETRMVIVKNDTPAHLPFSMMKLSKTVSVITRETKLCS